VSGVLSTRRAAILDAIRRNGAASVAELAAQFDVTQQTIRRDLHILNGNGLVQKGFGGAFAAPGVARYGHLERQSTLTAVKKRLVGALEEFFVDNATVFVGLGTTFASLQDVVVRHPGVLIATPNLDVAYSCALNTDATVYIYGGYVRNKDPAVLTVFDDSRGRFKFDVALIGASAVDEDGEVLEFDPMEVELTRTVLPNARRVVLVVHAEKFGRRAPHRVTRLADVDVLVTDGDPLPRLKSAEALGGVRVISVPSGDERGARR
jgi:DeoR family glycerol-3-phosphate regulon repressor